MMQLPKRRFGVQLCCPTGVTPRRDAEGLTSVRWSQTDRFAKADANKSGRQTAAFQAKSPKTPPTCSSPKLRLGTVPLLAQASACAYQLTSVRWSQAKLAKDDTTPRRNLGKEQIGSVLGDFA
ncbi:MAG: hypothetical protein MUD08_08665 [Cytophagales bacterium]|jgi:hypothetical protein|nr:hypothetical protein [Cytophagales bacterium]